MAHDPTKRCDAGNVPAPAAESAAPAEPAGDRARCPDGTPTIKTRETHFPFSNQEGQGFENRIAELVAEELDAELSYTWWAQRRGFIRNTLNAGACDLVIGVPAGYELVETTAAYYRSAYVYVYRADRGLDLHSIQDPRRALPP